MRQWKKVLHRKYDNGKDPFVQRKDNTEVNIPRVNRQPIERSTTSEVVLNPPKWTIDDGKLTKLPASTTPRVIPLESVYPEFDLLATIYGAGSYINRKLFKPTPNSFTRGIGGDSGLNDLRTSGIIRGNPKGTAVTAKEFSKQRTKEQFANVESSNPGITTRWYQNDLSKKDFDILKKEFANDTPQPSNGITLQKKVPLKNYNTYEDYLKSLDNLDNVPSSNRYNGTGEPYAYFYPDGRNPFKGYGYAKSKYGVRINNIDQYDPFIPDAHLHPTTGTPVSLYDSNVELFKRLPFNLGWKINK